MKTILVDALSTFFIQGEGIFKEMHELLEQYPNQKIILTNATDEEMKNIGFVNMPYPIFSLQHHPDKTNPEYFQKMLSHYNLTVYDVVYFEHTPESVESAKSVGIVTYWYDDAKKDLIALKKFLDESL
ncbi:hypothetical protein IT418_01885 [bacterium]|nr:hypothetical protein [bacterium]